VFGLRDLKNTIKITEKSVECPVKGCDTTVQRQRKFFRRQEEFKCLKHNIYISPSTFEYENTLDNLLWVDAANRDLLFTRIGRVKRESRISRNNSEDAVTWNIFRFLEKSKLLSGFLTNLTACTVENLEVIYWSYSQSENRTWSFMEEARQEFETNPEKGSEPDIIIKNSNALLFIECKLTANNNTVIRSRNHDVKQKYIGGGDRWYSQVFSSDFDTVAFKEKKYELLRFWLIGSWIAVCQNLNFYLINLVPLARENTGEEAFQKHIRQTQQRRFMRTTWEDVYHFIKNSKSESQDKLLVMRYLENKTIGYRSGGLQKAFSI